MTPDYRSPDDCFRYIDIRTEYDGHRYHLRQDTQAAHLDTFTVCLPPYVNEPGMVVDGRLLSVEAAFHEALTTLASLRSQPFVPLYPPEVFVPMGIIIATRFDVVRRDLSIRIAMLEGGIGTLGDDAAFERDPIPAEQRVAALGRAVALLRGAPLPIGSMANWEGLKIQ
jgi:hypothetical protein